MNVENYTNGPWQVGVQMGSKHVELHFEPYEVKKGMDANLAKAAIKQHDHILRSAGDENPPAATADLIVDEPDAESEGETPDDPAARLGEVLPGGYYMVGGQKFRGKKRALAALDAASASKGEDSSTDNAEPPSSE